MLEPDAWPAGIGLSLTTHPRPQLRYVSLDIGDFDIEDGDVILDGLNDVLGQLPENNVLEVLDVHIRINLDSIVGREVESRWVAWADDSDRILSDIGAFPVLRKVTIGMSWFIRDMELGYMGTGPMDRLVEARFPRLLESTAIDFRFFERWDCI